MPKSGLRRSAILGVLAPLLFAAGSASAQSVSAPLPPPMPPPEPVAVRAPGVIVHVESDRPVSLFVQQELDDPRGRPQHRPVWDDGAPSAADGADARPHRTRKRWVVVCDAPCDRELPLDATYRLDGPGVRATRPFRLTARPGEREVVKLDASSSAAFTTGIVIGGVGVLGLGIGLGAMLLAFSSGALGEQRQGAADPGLVGVGAAFLAGGGVVTLVGTLVFTGNLRSNAVQPGDAARAAAPPEPPRSEPGGRHAAWREVPAAPSRPSISVPLFSTMF